MNHGSPLLSSTRRQNPHEKSSLSGSFEFPKSYGSTTKPVRSGVDTRLVGHVLEIGDTLQGLAIRYGVASSFDNNWASCQLQYSSEFFDVREHNDRNTEFPIKKKTWKYFAEMEEIRRVNKLWANDNMHIHRILKIPVRTESQFANLDDVEVTEEIAAAKEGEDGDRKAKEVKAGDTTVPSDCSGNEKDEEKGSKTSDVVTDFLSHLDSQILQNVKQSEKLRNHTETHVLQSLKRFNTNPSLEEENLFRPLPHGAEWRNKESNVTAGRFVNKARSSLHSTDEQFFEL